MTISIDATSSSATANSYATEVEFIAYAATRLNVVSGTTVSGSTCSEDEKKALIEAQREITYLPWQAQRTLDTQSLAWPQRYCLDPDAPAVTGLSDIAQLYFDDGLPETAGEFLEGTDQLRVHVSRAEGSRCGGRLRRIACGGWVADLKSVGQIDRRDPFPETVHARLGTPVWRNELAALANHRQGVFPSRAATAQRHTPGAVEEVDHPGSFEGPGGLIDPDRIE